MTAMSRDVPIDPDHAALLVIDVQNYSVDPAGGMSEAEGQASSYFLERVKTTMLPNLARLLGVCRAARVEVIYTVIEALTQDGRDRSLDYKISGIHVPKGAWEAKVPDVVRPHDDEIVLPKTSSSVFISTNIDYVLRNLGVRSLIIAGLLTDQCVDSAVRDACDLGYLVTVATDACATHSEEQHTWSLRNNRGYCRQIATADLVAEIECRGRRG
jgi:ureidoacrylate peracid hydrolase